MKRDALTDLWKHWCDTRIPEAELPQGELMNLIHSRTSDVQRRISRRLRKEVSYYLMCIAITFTQMMLKPSVRAFAFFGVFVALQGVLIYVLHRKSREMALARPTGSTLEWIDELTERLAATSRSYLFAYLLFVSVSVTLLAVVTAVKMGWSLWTLFAITTAGAAVVVTYRGGARYLECTFGRYRRELIAYRQQLNEQ